MNTIKSINNKIIQLAPKHIVKDTAPNDIKDVLNGSHRELVIWSGASDNTIFNDPIVNYAFRALHDACHIKTRLGFTVAEEIELGRIQANQYTGLLADLIYIEVSEQAKYFQLTGKFLDDQKTFTLEQLKKLGYNLVA